MTVIDVRGTRAAEPAKPRRPRLSPSGGPPAGSPSWWSRVVPSASVRERGRASTTRRSHACGSSSAATSSGLGMSSGTRCTLSPSSMSRGWWATHSSVPPGATAAARSAIARDRGAGGRWRKCTDTRSKAPASGARSTTSRCAQRQPGGDVVPGGPAGGLGPLQRDRRQVDPGDAPAPRGQPHRVGALAAADVQGPAGRQVGDLGDELRVGLAAPDLRAAGVALVPELLVEDRLGQAGVRRTAVVAAVSPPWSRRAGAGARAGAGPAASVRSWVQCSRARGGRRAAVPFRQAGPSGRQPAGRPTGRTCATTPVGRPSAAWTSDTCTSTGTGVPSAPV